MPDEVREVRLGLLVPAPLVYFGIPALLASVWLKRRVAREHPPWMGGCRSFFNLWATVLLRLRWCSASGDGDPGCGNGADPAGGWRMGRQR